MSEDVLKFLSYQHPYDRLPRERREALAESIDRLTLTKGEAIYSHDDELAGLYLIESGEVRVSDPSGTTLSILHSGNTFGERGLLAEGRAATNAVAESEVALLCVPAAMFQTLWDEEPEFKKFFDRGSHEGKANRHRPNDLASVRVAALMAPNPVTCGPETTVVEAAKLMHERHISSLCILDGDGLIGLITLRDLVGRVLAKGHSPDTPVSSIMTPAPRVLGPSAIGSDVLNMMLEHRLGHLPVVEGDRLVGIVTQTDLTRYQAKNTAGVVADASAATDVAGLAEATAGIPDLLVHLVTAGHRHDVVTRMITDVADVVTRRLIKFAEAELGSPPCRYLWLACGSQGRKEQTGVSDQDNCLILEDTLDATGEAYFEAFAKIVSDGLDACGYVYCPGDMMATNPRWRQPLSVWREYFAGWIKKPSKEAQMLASVMFDLRPIGGDFDLFDGLQAETLARAAKNSIFTAHMASNALSHGTPLGLIRDFATIRSGEHRNTIDLKHAGVVPVVDLGRMYALQGKLSPVNTRARIEAAIANGTVSRGGGRDLLNAYDVVADLRLKHQAGQIKDGKQPDNFLPPASLSDFERSHLRNAFVVIKTMQSALMQGRGVLG